jgi:N-acyl-D-amino-acid deacylase
MHDLLIRGGTVIDGTGNPPFRADVAVAEGRIVALGHRLGDARHTIDAADLFVTPGFVDMHTHSDGPLLTHPEHEGKLAQGVTLEVLGHDGLAYAPAPDDLRTEIVSMLREWNGPGTEGLGWPTMREYLAAMDAATPAVNVAVLAPHGNLRLAAMGMEDRRPTDSELARMCTDLAACLDAGAVGLSTGLQYVPAAYADDDELVALCEVTAARHGIFAPHHRGYGRDAMQAYADCIEIARRSGVALHLTHAHLSYDVNDGRAPEFLAMIDRARSEGIAITLDSYPYTTANGYGRMFLPPALLADGLQAAAARLADAEVREALRQAIEVEGFEGVPVDWGKLEISNVGNPANRRWLGRTVAEAAVEAGSTALDFFCDLLASDELVVQFIEHIGSERNVQTIMRDRGHMGSSDGILAGDRPHPRGWGSIARYLGHYTRDLGLFRWEEIVRKLTSLPAQTLGRFDRGLLRPGMAADVVCFAPDLVEETATWDAPRSLARGFQHVLVNGVPAIADGMVTGRRCGRVLRRHDR